MTDTPNSPPLSQAALKVMVAATNGNTNVIKDPVYRQCIAAALRAAVDEVVPKTPPPKFAPHYEEGIWDGKHDAIDQLLAIAAELESANN